MIKVIEASKESSSSPSEPDPTESEIVLTNVIARDRPTIDAAVKSFISIICARTMTASNTDVKRGNENVMMGIIPVDTAIVTAKSASSSSSGGSDTCNNSVTTSSSSSSTSTPTQQQVLQWARLLIKAINCYTFPVHDTVASTMAERPGITEEKNEQLLEISVVARLWNGLVQSEQKPSRFLGRRALKRAWKNLDIISSMQQLSSSDCNEENNTICERQLEWLQEFERLLFNPEQPQPSKITIDDDSALIWAIDGGASEFAKRRQRRLDAAKERESMTPS